MTDRTPTAKPDGPTSQILRKITFWRRSNSTRSTEIDERCRDTYDNGGPLPLDDGSDEIRRFIAGQGVVIKSGYISRRRFKFGMFSKFFVLKDDGRFYCFKNERCDHQNGSLKLKEVFIVPQGKRSFSVASPHRVWNLKAKTNEDRDDWIEKLKLARACAQAKEENELEFLSIHQKIIGNANSLPEFNLTALKTTLHDLLKGVKSFDVQNNDLRKHYKQTPKSWFGFGKQEHEEDLQDCLIALSIKMSHVKTAAKKALEDVDNAHSASKRLLVENRYLREQRQRLIEQVEMQAKQLGLIEKATKSKGVKMNQKIRDELKKVEESYTNMPSDTSPIASETGSDLDSSARGSTRSSVDFVTAPNSMCPVASAIEYSCSAPSPESVSIEPLGEKKNESDSAKIEPITKTSEIVKLAAPAAPSRIPIPSAPTSTQSPPSDGSPVKETAKKQKEADVNSSKSESLRIRKQAQAAQKKASIPVQKAPLVVVRKGKRRTTIPPRREAGFALWSILKNALGKELSRIPLPVDFNEPISFIQRMTECLDNAHLLTRAAESSDPVEQLCYVAAFVVSCWCNTPFRTTKPFNPLWSETYECDRMDDLGWRSIAEQVSHHPPIGVIKAEGTGWDLEEDMQVCSQFQATAMRVYPEGLSTLLLKGNKRYSWTKRDVKTIVKGFIMGPLTLHNEGECTIVSHSNQLRCTLNLTKQSFFFSPDCRTFSGKIMDRGGKQLAKVEGNWTTHFDIVQGKARTRIWSKPVAAPGQEKVYNFSRFTIEMNEPEAGVAPTDSRLRPDMRLMEEGDWDKANAEKAGLEQKQREVMKQYTAEVESGKKVLERPVWFKKIVSPENGSVHYRYQNRYWSAKQKGDWSMCPEIYFNNK
uniref:PH domain-containing protein n=1 Tax=Steinernema glaseri TaxID=37863 RepID=A0A1I7YD71_9BILA